MEWYFKIRDKNGRIKVDSRTLKIPEYIKMYKGCRSWKRAIYKGELYIILHNWDSLNRTVEAYHL